MFCFSRAASIGAWLGKLAHVVFRRRGNGDSGFGMLSSDDLFVSSIGLYVIGRFRRVLMVPGPMTPRE